MNLRVRQATWKDLEGGTWEELQEGKERRKVMEFYFQVSYNYIYKIAMNANNI